MPTVTIPVLTPGDGQGDETMSQVPTDAAPAGDIDQDCAELLGEDIMTGHKGLLEDISANQESAAQGARSEATRKYAEVDPIQAAAAERVLKKL